MSGEVVESRFVTSSTNCVVGDVAYYTGDDVHFLKYYVSSSSLETNIELFKYIPENFSYVKHDPEIIEIFPFEIEFITTDCIGSLGSRYKNHRYEVKLNGKDIKSFYSDDKLSIEELESKLQEESKKWLDSQMTSTWKTT